MYKRKDVIGENPLAKPRGSSEQLLPGQTPALGGTVKLFGYKLPENLGKAFKIYCHARNKTASEVLEGMLQEFLQGKKIYPE